MGTDSFLDAHDLVQSYWVAGLLQNSVDLTKPSGEKVICNFLFFYLQE